jgi:hypothetical protein
VFQPVLSAIQLSRPASNQECTEVERMAMVVPSGCGCSTVIGDLFVCSGRDRNGISRLLER